MKRLRLTLCLFALLIVVAACAQAPADNAPVPVATLDRPDAIYKCGEEAVFSLTVTVNKQPLTTGEVAYNLSNDGANPVNGTAQLGEQPTIIKGTLDKPGVLRLTISRIGEAKMWKAVIGAAYEPEKILPLADEPADFVQYWESQKALLRAIAPDVQLTKLEASSNADQTTYLFSMANINGSRVYGWLGVPTKQGPLPAIMLVPGAGWRPSGPGGASGWAGRGFLAAGVFVHDKPTDLPVEQYDEFQKGELSNYPHRGADSRDTYYFRRIFLGCTRVMDYLMSRPEWDGKNLLVTGSSQGGGLSLVSAGLEPKVTAIAANVPALCDHSAVMFGRTAGWPSLITNKDENIAKNVAPYYDALNFARHVKCATVISCGYADATCCSSSVYATYSVLPQPKLMIPTPDMGHAVSKEFSDLSNKFLQSLGKLPQQ